MMVPGCFLTVVVSYSLVVSSFSSVGKSEQVQDLLVGDLVSRLQEWVVNVNAVVQLLNRTNQSQGHLRQSRRGLSTISP